MKVAIISGITGQDGAFLAAFLLKKQYRIIGLLPERRLSDYSRLEYLDVKDSIQFRTINLLKNEDIKKLLLEVNAAEFYNLAAISSVGFSFQQPLLTYDFNTRSVINILESIREVSFHTRFYQASSSEMFGSVGQSRLPIRESFLFHPVSPYGISKASAHWLTVNYREAYKLQTCCGILFNHESALRPVNFVIKKIINTAIKIKNGKDETLRLGNVSIVRDWGYAPFYVEAMWKMMQQEVMADYLICSGLPVSLRDFIQKVFNHLDLDSNDHISIDKSLLRSLDLDVIYGDNSKARKELGWDYDLTTDDLILRLIKDEIEFMSWESKKALTA